MLLRLTTRDGHVGQGEASPLPRYSRDDFDGARSALDAVDWDAVPEAEPGESGRDHVARLAAFSGVLPPSAAFALETAVLDVVAQRRAVPLWALFGDAEPSRVPLSSLLGGADDLDVVAAASRAVARGVHTVKVKLTGPRLGPQLDTLGRLRDVLGARALRLDANGTFDAATAVAELDALRACNPELVEEPVPTASLPGLGALPVPIALDESLQDAAALAGLEPHLGRLRCVALVLKPMALGGFARCLALAARARVLGLDVTFSHLFDGPVGLAAAAHLALAVGSRSRASGLDAHGGLEAWPPVALPFLDTTSVMATSSPGLGLPALEVPA